MGTLLVRDTARLFIAAFPNSAVTDAVEQTQRYLEYQGKEVQRHHLHLTIGFIGRVDREKIGEITESLAGLHCPAFDVTLQRTGYFSRSRSLWVGPDNTPSALKQLRLEVERRMRIGFDTPFIPHVTLARKIQGKPNVPATIRPIHWPVQQLSLVESTPDASGPAYHEIERWPLY